MFLFGFIVGLIWGFSNTWLLVIDTIATINASLMVFIIQNTQNREIKALHLKIDGLIKAENELIAVEKLGEEELDQIRKKIFI
ncbi:MULTISPECIES: low affinity iron permease family protein [Parachlamydia]|uniref:low affinity iron permease family protein n=1 Tax=Parachlamydia TaxID=83551 RepID=UPI0002E59E35|nr:low affinity iron permease family protein [Parachlamydia acanthamoebae]